jgi:hypothetical protein
VLYCDIILKKGAMIKLYLWIVLAVLVGCSAFTVPDTSGTLQAQNNSFVAEATGIAETARAEHTAVMATAYAAQTRVIEQNSINQQLLATVQAGNPPTQQVISIEAGTPYTSLATPVANTGTEVTAPEFVGTPDLGGMQFVDTVTTMRIREATDGCADGTQTQFGINSGRIYVVTRALQLQAGTQIGVDWSYEGQSVASNSWSATENRDELCIWFYLDSFSPGSWTVQISANGTPVSAAVAFTVTAS